MTTPTHRLSSLRKLINTKPISKFLEAHSGLTGLIAETVRGPNGEEFDGTWSSSLTSSAIKAKPDIETVDTSSRLSIVQDILEVTSKPLIYDGDTGGLPEIFHFTVRSLERLGVSACIIEDKTGLKQNSLFGTERKQILESIPEFCEKIKRGKKAQLTKDFMIIGRMESLIAGLGQEEALSRTKASIESGADGIMIHSKEKKSDEILEFLESYNRFDKKVPIVAVPTTYNYITECELAKYGVSICIYANHLLRASYPSMLKVAESILAHKRSKEADDLIMGIKPIINLISDNTQ